MREIDNNLNKVNFKGVQKTGQEDKIAQDTPQLQPATQKEINDLRNMPAAELGRSQVATSDSLDNDMKFLAKHPDVVANINTVIDKYAQTHSEEETLKFIDTALQEFAVKK